MTKIRLRYIHEYRDRKGHTRRYVRRRGCPQIALPGLPGSPEFMEAYRDAIAGVAVPVGRGYNDGTLGDLVRRYYTESALFKNLSASSQATYRFVLSRHVEKDGHRLVRDLPAEKAEKIIGEIGATRPGMANLSRSVLAAVFNYAIKLKIRTDNPFAHIETYKLGTRHTWTDEQLAAYEARWKLGTRERLAYAILLYTAQRVSDAVKLKRSDVLTIKQQKTGTELAIPTHPALARAAKAGPSNGIYLIGAENGQPVAAETLSRLISRAARLAGLPKECTAHGLRKANQRLLAERGATTKQMQAVSGHRSLKETERYSEQANQASLAAAAISLLPDENGTRGG